MDRLMGADERKEALGVLANSWNYRSAHETSTQMYCMKTSHVSIAHNITRGFHSCAESCWSHVKEVQQLKWFVLNREDDEGEHISEPAAHFFTMEQKIASDVTECRQDPKWICGIEALQRPMTSQRTRLLWRFIRSSRGPRGLMLGATNFNRKVPPSCLKIQKKVSWCLLRPFVRCKNLAHFQPHKKKRLCPTRLKLIGHCVHHSQPMSMIYNIWQWTPDTHKAVISVNSCL